MFNLLKQRSVQQRIFSSVYKERTIKGPKESLKRKDFIVPNYSVQLVRNYSLWRIPFTILKMTVFRRRLALFGLGGLGILFSTVLGPFLLVGVGGLAAVVGLKVWRFKRQIQSQLGTQVLNKNWPEFIQAFLQQQEGSFFGRDQQEIERESIRRVDEWIGSSEGRQILVEYGLPENITQNVSMRGSSFSTGSEGQRTELKIELELRNLPGTVLVAKAEKEKEMNPLKITDIRLVTRDGKILNIPITQTRNGGRMIEGEFRDL